MDLIDIPGIGEKTASALQKAGISTLTELLETYPRTYRAYTASTAKEAKEGDWIVLKGHLTTPISRHTAKLTTQLSTFQDHSGRLTLRWFNLPYLARSIKPNATYLVKGKLEDFRGTRQLVAPQLSQVDDSTPLTDQLIPIYRQIGALKPWILRTKIAGALQGASLPPDPLPPQIVAKYSLMDYHTALQLIHHPPSRPDLEGAIYRLSFQELYTLQLNALTAKQSSKKLAHPFTLDETITKEFIATLPFTLTASQQNAIETILTDLASKKSMHRLLAGEVGSGKTVIAAISALATHSAGLRTLVMAPTVILAEQLFDSLTNYLTPHNLTVSLILGSSKGDSGADVVIGTQALLNQQFENVGLVVIDEQHRFGVQARDRLADLGTHTLLMTATPIPRSLALTLFNYLDITRLTELPKGRLPVKTFVVSEAKRQDAYTWIKQEIREGNQVFMVTPLIEEAEESDLSPLKSLRSLESELKTIFPTLTIDVMHGRMSDKEKSTHLNDFKAGLTKILVATSMIEVGIDIPQANLIVIEDAERFGLAQLHQLRGRVGRGQDQGYCLLFTGSHTLKARERLKYFVRTTEGDKLAQYDLKDRGPGELFGTEQSGFFHLKLASIYDHELLEATHEAACLAT